MFVIYLLIPYVYEFLTKTPKRNSQAKDLANNWGWRKLTHKNKNQQQANCEPNQTNRLTTWTTNRHKLQFLNCFYAKYIHPLPSFGTSCGGRKNRLGGRGSGEKGFSWVSKPKMIFIRRCADDALRLRSFGLIYLWVVVVFVVVIARRHITACIWQFCYFNF